jgi:hypothetical protein
VNRVFGVDQKRVLALYRSLGFFVAVLFFNRIVVKTRLIIVKEIPNYPTDQNVT